SAGRQPVAAVHRDAGRLSEPGGEPAEPGGERRDQSAAGPGHRGAGAAAAAQHRLGRQHRSGNVESDQSADGLQRQRTGDVDHPADDGDLDADGAVMTISGVGFGSTLVGQTVQQLTNMQNQLDQLTQQLSTGQKAQTYAGLGSQAGLTVGLDAQLAAIDGYNNSIALAGTNLGIAQTALSQVASVRDQIMRATSETSPVVLNNNGQTMAQQAAAAQLDAIFSALNSQSGDRYLFSGSATNQPATDTTDHILNGNGAQAGL